MKKWKLVFMLCICMCMAGWSAQRVAAEEVQSSAELAYEDLKYTISNGEVTIIGYTGEGGSLVIPEKIEGKWVTEIGSWAFQDCSNLTSIKLPSNLQEIGNYAFSGCSNLTSITLSSNLQSIGNSAFSMTGITSITIPSSVQSIGEYAFSNSQNVTIYGYANSYAQTYAKENNMPFIEITGSDSDTGRDDTGNQTGGNTGNENNGD